MAEGGEEIDFTEDELATLNKLFAAMGARPKTVSKVDLRQWLSSTLNTSTTQESDGMVHRNPSTDEQPASSAQPARLRDSAPSAGNAPIIVTARKPWLMKFSGSEDYDVWRHQLLCLMRENHRPADVADAIRSSLQGKAAQLLVNLGAEASIDETLRKLDSVFGVVEEKANVLASFYSARQGAVESVADWSCRVEGLFARVRRLTDGGGATDEALRQMFWTGLHQELKDASSYYFDHIKSFDELRREIRRIETQHPKVATKPSCKSAQQTPVDTGTKLEALVQQLTSEVKNMKQDIAKLHLQGREDRRFKEREGQQRQRQDSSQIVCYRCGELGHVRIGCRTNITHVRQPQDFTSVPAARGGHRH